MTLEVLPSHAKDERGFTLVELLIYVLLMAVVVAIAAGIMTTGSKSSRYVETSARAATDAQTITRTITPAVRNAQQLWTSEKLVVVRDSTTGKCFGWSLVADSSVPGSYLVYGKITPGPSQPIKSAAPANGSGWIALARGIRPVSGNTPIFSSSTNGAPVAALKLDLSFTADTASANTLFNTSVSPRRLTSPEAGQPTCIG